MDNCDTCEQFAIFGEELVVTYIYKEFIFKAASRYAI